MSSRYEDRQELASKIDYEGGLNSFLEYGFDPHDCPEHDDNLYLTAVELMKAWRAYHKWALAFNKMLPDPK